jgi:L-ascorbate metabolism protein UlaG (beta-lactamase superfamily)
MRTLYWIVGIIIVAVLGYFIWNSYMTSKAEEKKASQASPVGVVPIEHATAVLRWGGTIIYTDPTDTTLLVDQPEADIVLITDIHGDHFSTSTLLAVVGADTTLIVPQAVADQLPATLAARAQILNNGESTTIGDLQIIAVPMYNLPESAESFHTKGRGNGYVLEQDGYRVYIAGDTAGTPEMRGLQAIDLALVPMNLPYTMNVDEAADAVLAFKPKIVYPYHYRGQDGLADVERFKQLVLAGNPNIEVVLAKWYPAQ